MLNKEINELKELLEEKGTQDLTVLHIREQSSWADYLLIGTVTSRVQALGLEKYIKDFVNQTERDLKRSGNKDGEENWYLYDMGDIVVNLMTREGREFYQLEELWFDSKTF